MLDREFLYSFKLKTQVFKLADICITKQLKPVSFIVLSRIWGRIYVNSSVLVLVYLLPGKVTIFSIFILVDFR